MKIESAFIVPTTTIELDPVDSLTYSQINAGWYTPPIFRRTRLWRFGETARRVILLRSLWRWTATHPPAPYGDYLVRLPDNG